MYAYTLYIYIYCSIFIYIYIYIIYINYTYCIYIYIYIHNTLQYIYSVQCSSVHSHVLYSHFRILLPVIHANTMYYCYVIVTPIRLNIPVCSCRDSLIFLLIKTFGYGGRISAKYTSECLNMRRMRLLNWEYIYIIFYIHNTYPYTVMCCLSGFQ